jgi:dipeptidyl-peptidase-4
MPGLARCLLPLLLVLVPTAIETTEASSADSAPSDLEIAFGETAEVHLYTPRVEWRPGHDTVIWVDQTDATNSRLMEFDPSSGDRRVLVDNHGLVSMSGDRQEEATLLDEPVWRPDGRAVLVNDGEDPYLFDLETGTLTLLETGAGAESHARFSPDGRRIAWVRGNDLWVYDLGLNTEIRLSHDGSDTIFNGVFDWVYEEELANRSGRAFEWADDGSAIVWLRLDDTEIPVFYLLDLMETHSRVTEQRYPKPGDPPPRPSLHLRVFGQDSTVTRSSEVVFGDPVGYIPRFGISPSGDLWYQEIDRAQEHLKLVRVDSESNVRVTLVEEADVYWTLPVDGLHFFADGSFLWLSRRQGHTHLWHHARADGESVDLSRGPWDVTKIVGVGAGDRFVWYQAARPNPMERRLFRVDLSTGDTLDLTPDAGTHSAELAASGSLLVTTSTLGTPPRRWVTDGSGARGAEIPVEHPIPRIDYADHRFIEVTADDGTVLNAMLLLPPDFAESKQYPVVVYTYGGPNAQVVVDAWPRTSGLFNHILTGRGFVVFALDNRGSAARGREFEGAVDLALGSTQLPDQLAGVKWLKSRSWVDPDSIGIWGWSYGGYMTAFALTHSPGTFAAGAAVAPVTDWRLYDSIYTERYMSTPEANPAGYAAGSVLDAVGDLADPLLVIHGTGDDNVHVQHTLQFADRAWREGVRFELMLLPNLGHGINAPGSHLQVFSAIADFFERHLMKQGEAKR